VLSARADAESEKQITAKPNGAWKRGAMVMSREVFELHTTELNGWVKSVVEELRWARGSVRLAMMEELCPAAVFVT
jgi:hypothetical protein